MIMPTKTKTRTQSNGRTGTTGQNASVVNLLIAAYNAEIETLTNYIANAMAVDGIRAERVRDALLADVPTELGHAQQIARRVRVLGGLIPGSQKLRWEQDYLQPSKDSTNVLSVIRGVIEAEEQAIELYQDIIDACEGVDYVTQDLAIRILADEQEHRRDFTGFLKEYETSR